MPHTQFNCKENGISAIVHRNSTCAPQQATSDTALSSSGTPSPLTQYKRPLRIKLFLTRIRLFWSTPVPQHLTRLGSRWAGRSGAAPAGRARNQRRRRGGGSGAAPARGGVSCPRSCQTPPAPPLVPEAPAAQEPLVQPLLTGAPAIRESRPPPDRERHFVSAGRQSRPAPLTLAAALVLGHPRVPAGGVGGNRHAGSSARRGGERPPPRAGTHRWSMGQPRPDPVPPPAQWCCRGGEPGTGAPGAVTAGGGCAASTGRGRDPRLASLSLSALPSPCPPPRAAGSAAAAATHRAGGTRIRGVLSSRSCRRPPHAAAMFRGHRACPAAAPGARGLPHPAVPLPPAAAGAAPLGAARPAGIPSRPASPHPPPSPRLASILSRPPSPQPPAIPARPASPRPAGIPAPSVSPRCTRTCGGRERDSRDADGREGQGWRGLLHPGSGTAS